MDLSKIRDGLLVAKSNQQRLLQEKEQLNKELTKAKYDLNIAEVTQKCCQSRTNGRIMNNFPDIRAKACDLLGEIPTVESKNMLVSIATEDKEPMVVTAAIRSLGNIGMNDNDEVVNMIEFVHKKYAALNPTSSLALEVLNAYEKLAPTVQNKNEMIQSISSIGTNYKYVRPVRQKALQLLKSIQGSNNSNNNKEGK